MGSKANWPGGVPLIPGVQNATSETDNSTQNCVDVDCNATADGSQLEVYTCNTAGGQIWQFRSDGGGYQYELYNPQSGRCLDIPSAKTDKETLQIYDCIGGNAQHYTLN